MGSIVSQDVLYTLKELAEGKVDRVRFNKLVELSYQIAFRYLVILSSSHKSLQNKQDDFFEDLAIESITKLFVKNSEGEFPISESFATWKTPETAKDETLYFLNKIIASRVNQQLQGYLRYVDPLYGKILDAVNYQIKKLGYEKKLYFGVTYVLETPGAEVTGTPVACEEFITYSGSFIKDHQFDYNAAFAYEREKQPAACATLPFNGIILTLKNFYADASFTSFGHNLGYEQVVIDEYVQEGLNEVKLKISDYYVANKKLSQQDAQKIDRLFLQLAAEFKNGGISRGMYQYVKDFFEDLTYEEYIENYDDIIEYLLKLFKTTVAESILKNI